MAKDDNVIIKKVSPYPIEALLSLNGQGVPCEIVKLVGLGCLANTSSMSFRPGQNYELSFTIPASSIRIISLVKVIKAYDKKVPAHLSQVTSETSAASGSPTSESAGQGEAGSKPSERASGKIKKLQTGRLLELHFLKPTPERLDAINNFLTQIGQAKR